MTGTDVIEAARAKRVKSTGEVFTPDTLVCEMLSKLPQETWEAGKTYCDPAVGNGQFLIWVLIRKISLGHNPTEALNTLYGVDIVGTNISETRLRLLKVLKTCGVEITEEHAKIVMKNIFWARPDVYPNGSLDYHFNFDHELKSDRIEKFWRQSKIILEAKEGDKYFIRIPSKQTIMENLKKHFPKVK